MDKCHPVILTAAVPRPLLVSVLGSLQKKGIKKKFTPKRFQKDLLPQRKIKLRGHCLGEKKANWPVNFSLPCQALGNSALR